MKLKFNCVSIFSVNINSYLILCLLYIKSNTTQHHYKYKSRFHIICKFKRKRNCIVFTDTTMACTTLYTCPVAAVHRNTRVLCHHFISAVQPAAVAACSLNICRVNTNSTKAPFLRANTGKYSM